MVTNFWRSLCRAGVVLTTLTSGLAGCEGGGEPSGPRVPDQARGVTVLENTDVHATAVITDGQITLQVRSVIEPDRSRSVTLRRSDGDIVYSVAMSANHDVLVKQVGDLTVTTEEFMRGLPRETEDRLSSTHNSPEIWLLSALHNQVEQSTAKEALQEIIAISSAAESAILGPAPEGAGSFCVSTCCGGSCDCHGHFVPTTFNGRRCRGGANARCPRNPPSACSACMIHDTCIERRDAHGLRLNCTF